MGVYQQGQQVRSIDGQAPARWRWFTVLVIAGLLAALTSPPASAEPSGFDDVPVGHVFEDEVAWLASSGITQGRGDGTFGLSDPVTRGAMAAFLFRFDGLAPGPTFVDVGVSAWSSCALAEGGDVWCWGLLDAPADGSAPEDGDEQASPTRNSRLGAVELLAVGGSEWHLVCGRGAGDRVRCDGPGLRLAFRDVPVPDTPFPIDGLDGAQRLSVGGSHLCGVMVDGTVRCAGSGIAVQDDNAQASTASSPVAGLRDIVDVNAGAQHTCALDQGGDVWCWGDNQSGQLGRDTPRTDFGRSELEPARVEGLGPAVAVVAGFQHTCAIDVQGEVWCWGSPRYGALGAGPEGSEPREEPRRIDGPGGIVAIDSEANSTCAIDDGGNVHCWGLNSSGQLGVGTTGNSFSRPERVSGLPAMDRVVPGAQHTCGFDRDGGLWCWGSNRLGQLGLGTTGELVPQPVRVRFAE